MTKGKALRAAGTWAVDCIVKARSDSSMDASMCLNCGSPVIFHMLRVYMNKLSALLCRQFSASPALYKFHVDRKGVLVERTATATRLALAISARTETVVPPARFLTNRESVPQSDKCSDWSGGGPRGFTGGPCRGVATTRWQRWPEGSVIGAGEVPE